MPAGQDPQKKTPKKPEEMSEAERPEQPEQTEEKAQKAAPEAEEALAEGTGADEEGEQESRPARTKKKPQGSRPQRSPKMPPEKGERAAKGAKVERAAAPEKPMPQPPAFLMRKLEGKGKPGGADKRLSPDGKVLYLSGEGLARPIEPPRTVVRRSRILFLVAVIIGVVMLALYLDGVFNGPAREQARLDESIQREVDLNLPSLPELIPLDDAGILAKLEQSGDTLYERTPAGSTEPFDVIKLPPGVSLLDAGALYLKGTASLTPSEAALLLNGSWDLRVDREQGINMVIHYADFTSGSLERATGNAARSQGFDTAAAGVDSGEDSSGNTFMSGTIDISGATYTWRVSALPLSEVYSQRGLPEDAAYVGIRIYS